MFVLNNLRNATTNMTNGEFLACAAIGTAIGVAILAVAFREDIKEWIKKRSK